MAWVDVRDDQHKLIFRLDPERCLIEHKHPKTGKITIVDLSKYLKQAQGTRSEMIAP